MCDNTTEYEHEGVAADTDDDDDEADENATIELEMQSLLSCQSSSENDEQHDRRNNSFNIHIPPSSPMSTLTTPLPNDDASKRPKLKRGHHHHHHHHPDPEVFITKTLSQIDLLEDDFDEFTHKKLLPVPIQIALEENIFGWSHLLSDVLGHILYPLISAILTYQAISLCYYAFDVYHDNNGHNVDDDDEGNQQQQQQQQLSPLFIGVRNVLTVASLIASYRTVRRRRKVWLTRYDPKLISSVDRDTEMGRKWALAAVHHP